MLQPRTEGSSRGKGQLVLLDCVDLMTWHIRPMGVQGFGGHGCTVYPNAIRVQGDETHLDF